MDVDGSSTVPTASVGMFQSKGINGTQFGNNRHGKHEQGRRHRSKSEGYDLHHAPDVNEILKEGVVKPVKDKAHDRKPRNNKGRGQPKKGEMVCGYAVADYS